MTQKGDKEGRTEQATEKRLKDALDEGNVPVSREAGNFAYLLAAYISIGSLGGAGLSQFVLALRGLLANVSQIRIESAGDAVALFSQLNLFAGSAALPFILVFAVAGVAASLVQNRPSIVWTKIAPDSSRISLSSGLKRIFGTAGLLEQGKTIIRFAIMAAAAWYTISAKWDEFLLVMMAEPYAILFVSHATILKLVAALSAMALLLLLFDLPAVRLLWHRSLRMSHQEIKDERRQSEGDSHIKARRRAIAQSRSRRRLARDVLKATVVIANPTHFAIALRYVRQEGGAPKVVSKGQDKVALMIRMIAERNGIPVVEDKALARSLYKKVAIDQMIPLEFYRVIAEILIKLQAKRMNLNRTRS